MKHTTIPATKNPQDIRYIFFGTPEFAADTLEKLLNRGFIPAAIVCNPDRPVGRKKLITPPAAKLFILEHQMQDPTFSVDILQPESLDESFMETLRSYDADVFIVAAYGKLMAQNILDIPKYGTIGVHPSMLPKYRGASPIQSALLNGEQSTGVSLFLIDEKMDHGPVIAHEAVYIGTMDYIMLAKKLAEIGGELLWKAVPEYIAGKITPRPQEHNAATFCSKFSTEDGFIDIHDIERAQIEGGAIALAIERKVRALNPEPGTWTMASTIHNIHFGKEKRVKILKADISVNGTLILKKIHVDGSKPIKL